uniref:SWIM-type domain-containing protein n=1 Tax=Lactuca sativa TaxID=4236 RepID=A0A9R1UMU0_LACSA|nr:hypothetical protein LSAT_V11C800448000 [Lactuca sativa]
MHIKPDEFENKWELIINEFNLEGKRWFNDILERIQQRFVVLPLQTCWIKERMGVVEIKLPENDVKCTCEHFNRFGTLCKHAFNILMKHGIKEIPKQYIENH